MTIILKPGYVTLAQLELVYRSDVAVRLDPAMEPAIRKSAARVAEIVTGEVAVYGINTGFGKLASVRIHADEVVTLQRNLILSHCCGVGDALAKPVVRLIMALKLISLGRGASGVRYDVIRLIEAMLVQDIVPVIPEQGSVGASGDLAPLAHMVAAMIGEGDAWLRGQRMPAAQALERAGLQPIVLAAKEGLALINGTQVSTALALKGLFGAHRALQSALISGALATDAVMGSTAPFHDEIHQLRGHQGQIDAARTLNLLLRESGIRQSHLDNDSRVQDPYCIRCQPQVDGAALDLIRQVAATLRQEANAVTDNPLLLSDNSVVSGGNFHAEPVAFAADILALAIAEIGAIAQRRIALLVDPSMSYGLPAFLVAAPGLNSGMMIAEVTSAALMSENKQMTHPASVDSTPTSANQEDHVSMACHGARRLGKMLDNLYAIIGIEAMAAVQGIEFRQPLKTSPALLNAVQCVRNQIAPLTVDRYMAGDIAAAARLVADGALTGAVGGTACLPPLQY
ncbi:histidine ammonia-lyase [Acerihabitans arboris]|uniref:Histidine ammonia-lyase n=1 Tax=Acerihabitans arboris TaxID=2691583 RepID=A0A845SGG5_9GAMM|nr:histidine ammonia-lyase [Acerihabitans arboris]NDL62156.1 histidine ammonia-lyase [Acerihabitans arboris]